MPPKQKRKHSTETHTGHEEGSQQLQAGGTSEQKKTRPDRAVKKAKRSEENETVVKACLIRHIHGDDSQKQAMRDALRARVLSFSKRVRVASLGLTHLVKKLFDGVQDVSTVQVPDKYFEQTFIRQLLLGTQDASKPDPDVADLHSAFPEYLASAQRHFGDRNIYSAGVTKYLTNVKNHMRVNLDSFMKRAVCTLHPDLDKSQKKDVMKRIKGHTGRNDQGDDDIGSDDGDIEGDGEEQGAPPDNLDVIVNAHRAALGLVRKTDKIASGWLKSNRCLPLILRYYVFINREMEAKAASMTPAERPRVLKRLFDVLPICKVKEHFITMDTSVLYGLMTELGYSKPSNYEAFDSMRHEHWTSVFKIKRLEGRTAKFTGTVETDGTAICVHYVREKTITVSVSEEEHQEEGGGFEVRPNDFVVGCDPGLVDIMAMAVPLEMEHGCFDISMRFMQSKNFSRARYNRESGIIDARKHSNKWNKEVKDQLDDLSGVSSRGASLQNFRDYVERHTIHSEQLWGEYTKPRWARQRMRLYGGKKRSFDTFFNELEDLRTDKSRRMVIAFGAGRAVAMKGSTPAPSSRAFRECQRRFVTVSVEEFRSTYTHAETGQVLAQVGKRVRPRSRMQQMLYGQETRRQVSKRSKVRGLLWCDSTSEAREHFLNRDLNAAANIRRCLIFSERPVELRRETFIGQPLVHRVGYAGEAG